MTGRGAALALALLVAAVPAVGQERGAAAMGEPGSTAERAPADAAEAAVEAGLPPITLTPEQEERARGLESMFKCPVCRSQSVRSSDSFMAKDMQRKIREMIAGGSSDQEIVDYFTARYGDWILLAPPKRGFNWAAWLLPFAVVAAGAVGLFVAARRRSGRPREEADPGAAAVESPPRESPYLDRLERELEESE